MSDFFLKGEPILIGELIEKNCYVIPVLKTFSKMSNKRNDL